MKEHYRGSTAYARAKLINLLWTYELARRLEGTGVTVNVADPSGASTEMTRSEAVPWIFRTINRLAANLMTIEKAAQVSIYLASSPEVEGVNGEYFDHSNKRVKSSKASYEEAAQKRVWGCVPSSRSWIKACRSKRQTERNRSTAGSAALPGWRAVRAVVRSDTRGSELYPCGTEQPY